MAFSHWISAFNAFLWSNSQQAMRMRPKFAFYLVFWHVKCSRLAKCALLQCRCQTSGQDVSYKLVIYLIFICVFSIVLTLTQTTAFSPWPEAAQILPSQILPAVKEEGRASTASGLAHSGVTLTIATALMKSTSAAAPPTSFATGCSPCICSAWLLTSQNYYDNVFFFFNLC